MCGWPLWAAPVADVASFTVSVGAFSNPRAGQQLVAAFLSAVPERAVWATNHLDSHFQGSELLGQEQVHSSCSSLAAA